MRRVVITGSGAITSLGKNVRELIDGIENKRCATRTMSDWEKYTGLQSLVGSPVTLPDVKHIPRKIRRSMGRISLLATFAVDEALRNAGINLDEINPDDVGCIFGSTMGGAEALNDTFETMLPDLDLSKLTSMKFFQCVSHTVAMNIAQYLGLQGYVMATSAACASSLQAIGTGYELIKSGKQNIVLCGGSEELHPTVTGSFDVLFATSSGFNDEPKQTPRPFDRDRDGIVCGEGAGVIVLEEYERALHRGANVLGEITGYHTCGSGNHVSQSDQKSMVKCMKRSLKEASVAPENVDFISAHATATKHGDVQEAQAIYELFGGGLPVHSLKGYFGHTLGASGAIELAVALDMMAKGLIYPTKNLINIDEECKQIYHVREKLEKDINIMIKNCFAFGGINASLVLRKI